VKPVEYLFSGEVGIGNVEGIYYSVLSDGKPTFIIDTSSQNELSTYVLSFEKDALKWVNESTLDSTRRPYDDGEGQRSGIIGSSAYLIPEYVTGSDSNSSYLRTDWYQYSSAGTRSLVTSTFVNSQDGWYYVLGSDWVGNVKISKLFKGVNNGESVVTFSASTATGQAVILEIYTTSKVLLPSSGVSEDRILLYNGSDFVVSALIPSVDNTAVKPPSEDKVKDSFVIIPHSVN